MKKNIILISSIVLTILLFNSCIDQIKEPVLPSWDVEFNIPIGNKTYTIEDFVKNQDQIEILPTKVLKFTTDTIDQDTTLDFLFSNTFDMEADTSFPVVGTTLSFQMIAGRDSVRMDSATIESGDVEYTLRNDNPSPVFIEFVFPGFTKRTPTGIDTFKISANVPANQQVRVRTPINDYDYRQPPNQPFGSTRSGIWIRGTVSSSLVGIGQNLAVNFQIKNMKFRSFAGRVKPFDLGSRKQSSENALSGELKDFIKATTFNQIALELKTLTTFTGFDVLLKDFQIIGKYKNGLSPVYLLFNGNNKYVDTIPAGSQNTIIFSTANTNVNDFLKATPDSIEIQCQVVINPKYNSGKIRSSDKISFSIVINAYSQMKIENGFITDTMELDFSQETKDKISNSNNAALNVEISNAIPFDVQLVGYFLDKNKNKLFYFTRQTDSGSPGDTVINISSATINSAGESVSPQVSNINLALSKTDFEKFKDAVYLVQRFKINSAENRSVLIKATDYVKVKVNGKINYKIEENN